RRFKTPLGGTTPPESMKNVVEYSSCNYNKISSIISLSKS
ncbi:hypothetical protein OKW33_006715, partial [Paraburkholderia atlantica]